MEVLGIDIGGSGIKSAPVDLDKGALTAERLIIPTPQPATPDAVAKVVAELTSHFNWSGPVGCGLPAVVRNGVAQTAANIDPSWIGVPVTDLLHDATSCPVTVVNDADAAGIAEMRYGAGQGRLDTVLLITGGTGLGTAVFREGTLLPNTELGHIVLQGKDAEHYASATAKNNGVPRVDTTDGHLMTGRHDRRKPIGRMAIRIELPSASEQGANRIHFPPRSPNKPERRTTATIVARTRLLYHIPLELAGDSALVAPNEDVKI